MLAEVAGFQEELLDVRLARVSVLIRPLLMLLMGLIVGCVIIVVPTRFSYGGRYRWAPVQTGGSGDDPRRARGYVAPAALEALAAANDRELAERLRADDVVSPEQLLMALAELIGLP